MSHSPVQCRAASELVSLSKIYVSQALSGSLWLTPDLSMTHSATVIFTKFGPLWLTLDHSRSLWLSPAHSGLLWLSQALIGSQGPSSARYSVARVYSALINPAGALLAITV